MNRGASTQHRSAIGELSKSILRASGCQPFFISMSPPSVSVAKRLLYLQLEKTQTTARGVKYLNAALPAWSTQLHQNRAVDWAWWRPAWKPGSQSNACDLPRCSTPHRSPPLVSCCAQEQHSGNRDLSTVSGKLPLCKLRCGKGLPLPRGSWSILRETSTENGRGSRHRSGPVRMMNQPPPS